MKTATTKMTKRDGEFRVRLFIGGVYQAGADYFTDDKEDAISTAKAMIAKAVPSDKSTPEARDEMKDYKNQKENGEQPVTLAPDWSKPDVEHLTRINAPVVMKPNFRAECLQVHRTLENMLKCGSEYSLHLNHLARMRIAADRLAQLKKIKAAIDVVENRIANSI